MKIEEIINADDAYSKTVEAVIQDGSSVSGGKSLSTGSGKDSMEILNYCFELNKPVDRLIWNPSRKINLPAAVGRFVWMMAGSDRLADIAFYEPKVSYFSDDDVSVPGSSYGKRMIQPRPGLNQLQSAIDRLKEDPSSRRASLAIYHPEDAVRESRDIPCTLGLNYHIRDGILHSTTLMRSNNAVLLLPYNIFEFTLLAEIVSVECGVKLGPMFYHALSMHVYDEDHERGKDIVNSYSTLDRDDFPVSAQMSSGDQPLEQVKKLIQMEAQIRHGSAGITSITMQEWISRGEEELPEYWLQFYLLLLYHTVKSKADVSGMNQLYEVLRSPWRDYLEPPSVEETDLISTPELTLFELEDTPKLIQFTNSQVYRDLLQFSDTCEKAKDPMGWREFAGLQEECLVLAAKGQKLDNETFLKILTKIREHGETI